MSEGEIIFRLHAVQRMFERNISEIEVREVIEAEDVIERYPDDLPFPSRLLLGFANHRPLHVVATQSESGATVIITVYKPAPEQWEQGFRRRRK